MQNVAAISKVSMDRQVKTTCGEFSIRKTLLRFHRFIETTDWDKVHLLNEGIDSVSLYLIVTAFICFVFSIAVNVFNSI